MGVVLRRRAAGTSLVEVLVAGALMLVVATALLPMFTRAMTSNLAGNDATNMSNHGRAELEDTSQLAFNNWELSIQSGIERSTPSYWTEGDPDHLGDEEWLPGAPPEGDMGNWARTTTVRQYQLTDLEDNDGDGVIDGIAGIADADNDGFPDNPLAAGAAPNAVHLKEIVVQIDNRRASGVTGPAEDLRLRVLKAF